MMWMVPLNFYCGTVTSASQVVLPHFRTPTQNFGVQDRVPPNFEKFLWLYHISYVIDANCFGWWFQPL